MTFVRRATKEDWESIVKLLAQHNLPFPSFKNILTAIVIVRDDKVIAFAFVKTLAEVVFIPDLSSKRNVISSLKLVYDELLKDVKEMKLEQVHLFTTDLQFAEILKEHFHFDEIIGEGLVLEVANG